MSATEGGVVIWKMLALAEKVNWSGLADAESSDKNAIKRAFFKIK